MWQSQVEIEHYSVRMHYRIQSAVKGGVHMCCVNVVSIYEFTVCIRAPLLTLEHFKRNNVIEICNGIMFDFYPGLPYMVSVLDLL